MVKYDKYKPSGVEWIGEIPEHWKVKRLKYLLKLITDKYNNSSNKVGLENIESETGKFITTESDFEGDGVDFCNNDILYAKLRPYLAKTWVANCEGSAVGDFFVLRSQIDTNPNYFGKVLLSDFFTELSNGSTFGSKMPRVSWDFLSNILLTLPPTPEQEAIAAYLDEKCGAIDAVIESKERLLELYAEKRQAIINRAVTHGIDPSAPLRDSGIPWLGLIPAHWQVKRLKWVVKEKLMYGANESAEIDDKTMPRYIRITDFGANGKLKDETFRSLPGEIAKDYILKEGDVLFARSGATVGKTFQFKNYEGDACFAGYLIKATPNTDEIYSDYLYYYTKSGIYDNWKNSIFNQATIQNIGADKYAILDVTLPPLTEQTTIVNHIEEKCGVIDTITEKFRKQIELYKEYRTALIANAVTGKIKVTK